MSIAGDDAPVPILERSWVRDMREESDPQRRLRILARNGRLMLGRWAPIYEVLRSVAAADQEIASLLELNFATRSPENYRLLVTERGWSADRFERWYGDALARLLLTFGGAEPAREVSSRG